MRLLSHKANGQTPKSAGEQSASGPQDASSRPSSPSSILEEGEIICPNCGEKLEFDLSDLANESKSEDED